MNIQNSEQNGIALISIVVIAVLILIVAAASVYLALGRVPGNTSTQTTRASSTSHLTTASSLVRSVGTTSTARSSSSAVSGLVYYSGTFNFSIALGPSGVRDLINNTVQTYGTTQVASGSFSFFINPGNYSGRGSGHGTMVATTTGFCSGQTTFPYTFVVSAFHLISSNFTIYFSTPKPSNFTVALSCTGSMVGVNTDTNEPTSFLPEYPGEITTMSLPVSAKIIVPPANWTYGYTVVQTN